MGKLSKNSSAAAFLALPEEDQKLFMDAVREMDTHVKSRYGILGYISERLWGDTTEVGKAIKLFETLPDYPDYVRSGANRDFADLAAERAKVSGVLLEGKVTASAKGALVTV